jgi:predicted DNA-binding protein
MRVNAIITTQQYRRLLKLSEQTGVKLSWLVQSAIAQYLERAEPTREGGNSVTSMRSPPDEI